MLTALYGPLGEDEFCAGPDVLGLPVGADALEPFLARLGVATRVRRRALRNTEEMRKAGLEPHVRETLAHLTYPQTLAERTFHSAEAAEQGLSVHYGDYAMPDRWKAVLERGAPEAVIAYVAAEALHHIDAARPTGIVFHARTHSQYNTRECPSVTVTDPVLYLLRETAWVPCDDGARHPPRHVVLSRSAQRLLGATFRTDRLDVRSPLLAQAGGKEAVRLVLQACGAVQSLDALRGDDVYALLLELPARDPSGAEAPAVYRTLLDAGQLDITSPRREEFVRDGRMWGERAGAPGYFPVPKLRYAARGALPDPIRAHVALVDIVERRSATEVQRLFGVRPLDPAEYEITVDEEGTVAAAWAPHAAQHFRACIPFLYARRLAMRVDDRGEERRAFAALDLTVVRRVAALVHLEGQPSAAVVLEDELRGLAAGRGVFVVTHEPRFSLDPVLWRAVADLVGDVIDVQSASADFGALLTCADDHLRLRLLDHMTGGRGAEKLAEAREALAMPATAEDDLDAELAGLLAPLPAPRPTPEEHGREGGPNVHPNRPAAGAGAPQVGNGAAPPGQSPTDDGELLRPIAAPAARETGPRGLVVTRGPTASHGSGSNGASRAAAPEDESLRVAERFEELADPPRFTVRVSHLRGTEAYGCDLISFATAEEKDQVVRDQSVPLDSVARFIEVKARTQRTVDIELTENERDAADRFGERYFVYRVTPDPGRPGSFELAVLGNPTASPGAYQETRWLFSMAVGSGADWYRLRMDDAGPPGASPVIPLDHDQEARGE